MNERGYLSEAETLFIIVEVLENKHFEGSCELLRFDAFALLELLL